LALDDGIDTPRAAGWHLGGSATSLLSGSRRPPTRFFDRSRRRSIRGSGRSQPPPTRLSSRAVLSGGDGGSRSFFCGVLGKNLGSSSAFLPRSRCGLQHWVLQSPIRRRHRPVGRCWRTISGRSGAITKRKARWRASTLAFVEEPRTSCCGSGDSLTTASRQGDKTTTSDYQAGQSRAYDRTGNDSGRLCWDA
jgi:hypothetical protein